MRPRHVKKSRIARVLQDTPPPAEQTRCDCSRFVEKSCGEWPRAFIMPRGRGVSARSRRDQAGLFDARGDILGIGRPR
jgi:hypothetical protein